MSKFYLNPKTPVEAPPSAERRSVERISPCCMDINGKGAYLAKGRNGAAWWLIWMTMMCWVLVLSIALFSGRPWVSLSAGTPLIISATVFFGATLYIWPLRVWRTHLPIRFNRRNRKVYLHWKGKTYIEDWDSLRVYLSIQGGVTATGAPVRDPQINIEFLQDNGKYLTAFIMGNDHDGTPLDQKPLIFWEYIRRYMEEGPDSLPEPEFKKTDALADLVQIRDEYRLLPIWPENASGATKILNVLQLPFILLWDAVSYPTEIIFYYLTRNIRTDPFPPEMEEPCRCDGEPAPGRSSSSPPAPDADGVL